jgi:hypothetical protein
MLNAFGYLFAHVMDQIDEICEFARRDPTGTWKSNVATGSMADGAFATLLGTVTYLAEETGMRSVQDQVRRIRQWTEMLDLPLSQIAPECIQLRIRIEEELRRKDFLFVSEEMTELYNKCDPRRDAVKGTDPFELGNKFKKAHADIASAGRCLAVGESTACVFHLMRGMEVAVRDLSSRPQMKLTITPQTTWRQLTNLMDGKIAKMPDNTNKLKRKKNQWEEARANLHHIGSVWRNNTMHPATSYTPSQAKDVFEACRVFMTALSRL